MKIERSANFHDRLHLVRERLLPIYPSMIDHDGIQAVALFNDSRNSTSHFEGGDAIDRILKLVQWQREDGYPTLPDLKMVDRLDRLIGLGEAILGEIHELHSIIVYGSSLRGKAIPGDHDVMLVPRFGFKTTEAEVTERLANTGVQLRFDRATVSFYVLDEDEPPQILSTGPYLLLTRTEQRREGVPGLCRGFLNDAGEGWELPR